MLPEPTKIASSKPKDQKDDSWSATSMKNSTAVIFNPMCEQQLTECSCLTKITGEALNKYKIVVGSGD